MSKMKMPKNMWVCFFVLVAFFAFIWMYTSSMKEGFSKEDAKELKTNYAIWRTNPTNTKKSSFGKDSLNAGLQYSYIFGVSPSGKESSDDVKNKAYAEIKKIFNSNGYSLTRPS